MDPRWKTLLLAIALIPLALASENKTLMEKFADYKLVPDIIPEAPSNLADVSYGKIVVQTGTAITSEQSQQTPCVKWPADDNSYHTLILIDPDIPPQVPAKEIIHWLVVNIPGNDIDKGVTLFEYIGCTPPKGNPPHRYAFLVYKQDEQLVEGQYKTLTDEKKGKMSLRMKTTLREVLDHFQLHRLIAGNFHTTVYDENVPRYWNETFEKYD